MNKVTISTAVKIQITCMPPTYNLFRSVNPYFCRSSRKLPFSPCAVIKVRSTIWPGTPRSVRGFLRAAMAWWRAGLLENRWHRPLSTCFPLFAVTVWDDLVLGGNHTGEFYQNPDKHTVYTPPRRPFSPYLWMPKTAFGAVMAGGSCHVVTLAMTCVSNNNGTRASQNPVLLLPPSRPLDGRRQRPMVRFGRDRQLQRGAGACESCYWALHLKAKNVVLSGGQDGQLRVQRRQILAALDVHQRPCTAA